MRRLDRLEEHLIKLREDFNRLYEKSLEHDKRFEAIERKLMEHDRRFEVIERKLLEHDKRFGAIEEKLLEHDRRFNRIELSLGALTESFYAKAVWDDLVEEIRARGEKLEIKLRNARIDEADIDLLVITDKSVYAVEIKVKPKHDDVRAPLTKEDLIKKHYPGENVIPVLAGALIGREVEEYAFSKGVKVYEY